jgi:hypothetical protein
VIECGQTTIESTGEKEEDEGIIVQHSHSIYLSNHHRSNSLCALLKIAIDKAIASEIYVILHE